MGWGLGMGASFGQSTLVPATSPAAVILGQPISFEFSDERNNPLPGAWEFLVLSDDGAGGKTSSSEPAPTTYFRVASGVAGWLYRRAPALPAPAAPFDERGVLASPTGVLLGRNAEVAVAFRSPTDLLDGRADEFVFEVLIGLRANDAGTAFVGGRARAAWAAGVWAVPLVVEPVSAAGSAPLPGTPAVPPDIADLTDVWRASPKHELRVTLRGTALVVALDGYIIASAAVADASGSKPIILVRAYNRTGAGIVPVPCLLGVSLRSLRDPGRLGPPPAIVGDLDLENAPFPHILLPLEDLVAKGLFKRRGARSFIATQDINVDGLRVFQAGDPVRATEAYEGGAYTPVVIDYAQIRAERRGSKNG